MNWKSKKILKKISCDICKPCKPSKTCCIYYIEKCIVWNKKTGLIKQELQEIVTLAKTGLTIYKFNRCLIHYAVWSRGFIILYYLSVCHFIILYYFVLSVCVTLSFCTICLCHCFKLDRRPWTILVFWFLCVIGSTTGSNKKERPPLLLFTVYQTIPLSAIL